MLGFWDGTGISWTICKQSAPRSSRQITTPTPNHSIFTDRMLLPNQQCQSSEGHVKDMNNRKRAKINEIGLTRCQGRYSALTEAQKTLNARNIHRPMCFAL